MTINSLQREWTKISRDTGVGNPSRANPEKGRKYLDEVIHRTGEFLVDLAACDSDALYE